MNALLRVLRKIAVLLRRESFDRELQEEMAFHREQAAKEFEASGITPEAARYAAMRQFGNATLLQERSHEVMEFRMETVVQDLRFAIRQLQKNPGLAVTAIVVLALGIGASTAIFGFVDAVLIQPLPYASPNRLVDVDESEAVFPRTNLSRDDYEDWKRLNTTLSSLDVYGGTGFLLRTGSVSEPVPAARVSDGFFRTLGVTPILGRDFRPGEDRPGGPKIAMLTYGTWMKRFGGRREVIGESVSLTGEAYTIVGVLPRSFAFAPRASAEFWVPLLDKTGCEKRRSCHNLDGVGRLRDGVTVQAALADVNAIAAHLALAVPGLEQGAECKRASVVRDLCGQAAADSGNPARRGSTAAADCLRECGQPDVGASGKSQARNSSAGRSGRHTRAFGSAVCHRRPAAGRLGMYGGSLARRRNDVSADAGNSKTNGAGYAVSRRGGTQPAYRVLCRRSHTAGGISAGGHACAAARLQRYPRRAHRWRPRRGEPILAPAGS